MHQPVGDRRLVYHGACTYHPCSIRQTEGRNRRCRSTGRNPQMGAAQLQLGDCCMSYFFCREVAVGREPCAPDILLADQTASRPDIFPVGIKLCHCRTASRFDLLLSPMHDRADRRQKPALPVDGQKPKNGCRPAPAGRLLHVVFFLPRSSRRSGAVAPDILLTLVMKICFRPGQEPDPRILNSIENHYRQSHYLYHQALLQVQDFHYCFVLPPAFPPLFCGAFSSFVSSSTI